jgi:hypothetical protein
LPKQKLPNPQERHSVYQASNLNGNPTKPHYIKIYTLAISLKKQHRSTSPYGHQLNTYVG